MRGGLYYRLHPSAFAQQLDPLSEISLGYTKMFSTSTGSSPQTAPTTPDSSSNTGSDDFASSQPEHEHNESHGPDLWGYSLNNENSSVLNSSHGVMLEDVGMGLEFDDRAFESGQGMTPGMDQCSMPLQDLIHENLIS